MKRGDTKAIRHLIATDVAAGMSGSYLIDTALGSATLIAAYNPPYSGLAFAEAVDLIMSNGFDP